MDKNNSFGAKAMQRSKLRIRKQAVEIRTIKLFLLTLLGKRQANFPFEVQRDGSNIKITTKKEYTQAIIDVLQKDFRKNLPYKLQTNNQVATNGQESVIEYDLPPLSDVDNAKKIMLNLFGKKAFKALKLDVEETFKEARFKEGVLFLQTDEDQDIHEVFEATQKYLCSYFLDVPRTRIQNAWLGKEALSKGSLKNLPSVPQGPVKQCFGVTKQSGPGGKSEMYVDLGQLEKLLFPPKVVQRVKLDESVELTVDAKHFNLFIGQFTDNVVLRVTPTSLQPILIAPGSDHANPKKPQLRILVDQSGSMTDYFDGVRSFLKTATTRALEEGAEKIETTPFSDRVYPSIVCTSINKKECEEKINQLKTISSTALLQAIENELDKATPAQLEGAERYNLIILTDGMDDQLLNIKNNKQAVKKTLDPIRTKLRKFKIPPKIFTVGQGSCDHELLTELALVGGTPYIHLKDPNKLNEIFDQLPDPTDMMSEHEKVQLSIQIAGQAGKTYEIDLPHNGKLHAPEINFPFQEGQTVIVTRNGNKLVISPNVDEIPETDLIDHLLNIEIESHQAIVNFYPDIDIEVKYIAELREKVKTLRKLADAKNYEDDINELDAHLQGIQEDLELGKNNPAIHNSLYTRAKNWQGFAEITAPQCDPIELQRSGGHCGLQTNSAAPRLTIPNPIKTAVEGGSALLGWLFAKKPRLSVLQPVTPVTVKQKTKAAHVAAPFYQTCKKGDNNAENVAHRAGAALTRAPEVMSFDDKLTVAAAMVRIFDIDALKPIRPYMTQIHLLSENDQIKNKLSQYLSLLTDGSQDGLKVRLNCHKQSKYLAFRLEQINQALAKLDWAINTIQCALKLDKITQDQFKKVEQAISYIENTLKENKLAKHASRQSMLRNQDLAVKSSGQSQTYTVLSKSKTRENYFKDFLHGFYKQPTEIRASDLDDLSLQARALRQ